MSLALEESQEGSASSPFLPPIRSRGSGYANPHCASGLRSGSSTSLSRACVTSTMSIACDLRGWDTICSSFAQTQGGEERSRWHKPTLASREPELHMQPPLWVPGRPRNRCCAHLGLLAAVHPSPNPGTAAGPPHFRLRLIVGGQTGGETLPIPRIEELG